MCRAFIQSNVLIKSDEDRHIPVLADFSVSYFVEGQRDPLTDETIFETTLQQVGNPAWLSPELLRKLRSRGSGSEDNEPCISMKGDVYAFGCVFLEVRIDSFIREYLN